MLTSAYSNPPTPHTQGLSALDDERMLSATLVILHQLAKRYQFEKLDDRVAYVVPTLCEVVRQLVGWLLCRWVSGCFFPIDIVSTNMECKVMLTSFRDFSCTRGPVFNFLSFSS